MIFPHVEYQTYKDTMKYEMRPLSDRKSCEHVQNLVAHFQLRFLGLQIKFLQETECKNSIRILRNRH